MWRAVHVGVLLACAVLVGAAHDDRVEAASACASGASTPALNSFFSRQVADLVGFDGPVVVPLPDGRRLWFVRDAFIAPTPNPAPSLRPPTGFAHNAALVQSGDCFTSLHGALPDEGAGCTDASYLARDLTVACTRWFWPLSGAIDSTGHVAVFLAEMGNPEGTGAAPPASARAVWLARLDPVSLEVVGLHPAPASAADVVYGYGLESDAAHSYLFGWSFDLFGVAPPGSRSPSAVHVARVPVGRFDLAPEYWNGSSWTAQRSAARPISDPGDGAVNPMQPRRFGTTWVSVVKPGGWWGTEVRVDVAPAPEGPWTTVQRATVPTRTLDGRTNTYDAHLLPWRSEHGNLVVALSNNAWEMDPLAFDDPSIYRPTFFELASPRALGPGPPPMTTSGPLAFLPRQSPIRVLDTRQTVRQRGGETRVVSLDGVLDSSAVAGVVNLTLVDPDTEAYLTAWACDAPFPDTSNVNALAGEIRAAHSIVAVAADRTICVYVSADTDVLVDLTGSYVPAGAPDSLGFRPLAPTRIYDSRSGAAPFAAGETRRISVPPDATAVVANVTVADARSAGYVTVFPCDVERPVVSNVNMVATRPVANLVEVATRDGAFCVYSFSAANVIVDLVGTFDARPGGLWYEAVQPTRLTDTRNGIGTVFGRVALDAGVYGTFPANAPVARSNIPDHAGALVVSMVATSASRPGWGVVAPCAEPGHVVPYGSSTLNFEAGGVVANQSIVTLDGDAPTCTFTHVAAHHIVDLVGWFVAPT